MKTMTPITERSVKRMGRLKAGKLEAYCQRHRGTKDTHTDIFDAHEERIPQIAEVTKAEEAMRAIYSMIAAYSQDLADDVDMAVGALGWAYEKQGFNAGIAIAKGMP